ncbi:hypothetical protein IMCC3135_16920 [Granulosicoccus antarcticus IMCC3135]|uniref:Uncharacterized protein n=1 Tax=Granulosicoccus antarcticus IMCC3135 TaxID=1192854 RepID=A0A2Z2NPU1_9GAMM|nr:hypothetical protein IMCC3135_16920 [Granulosicoccus antarcticus IMCC3135]
MKNYYAPFVQEGLDRITQSGCCQRLTDPAFPSPTMELSS